MNSWNILGITPTGDKSAIKSAYAHLLKDNRPDEKPESFAQLHEAYRKCLKLSSKYSLPDQRPPQVANHTQREKSQSTSHQDQSQTAEDQKLSYEERESSTSRPSPSNSAQIEIIGESTDTAIENLNQSWELITQQTQQAFDNLQESDNTDDWLFLSQSYALYDFEFKNRYNQFLFQELLDFFNQEQNPKPNQRRCVLNYIDSQLYWHNKQALFESYYGKETVETLFEILDANHTQPHNTSFTTRQAKHQTETTNKAKTRSVKLPIIIYTIIIIYWLIQLAPAAFNLSNTKTDKTSSFDPKESPLEEFKRNSPELYDEIFNKPNSKPITPKFVIKPREIEQ